MHFQTTIYFCVETAEFAVFDAPVPLRGAAVGDPEMVAAGALRRQGDAWFFAHSLLPACEGFSEVGPVLLGPDAPRAEADAAFATKHAFDGACLLLCGETVGERMDLLAREAEHPTEAA